MRWIWLFVFIFGMSVFAAEKTVEPENSQKPAAVQEAENPTPLFSMDELRSFYVGYSRSLDGQNAITLDIQMLDSLDGAYWFRYAMNSPQDIHSGEGTIYPVKNIIEFDSGEKGIIYRNDTGNIVLESIKQDSTNYWIMEEN